MSRERAEQRLGCRLEATGERRRRAPSPPLAKNPGCGGKGSTRIHPRKSAKPTALQQKTKNPKNPGLVQRGAFWRTYYAGVMSCALGPFRAVAGRLVPRHHSCVIYRALAAPEKKGWILGIPGIPLRRNGSGEKSAVDPLGFFGLRRGFFPSASRQRYALAPFVACGPHQSGRGALLTKKRLDSPNQPTSPPLIPRRRFPSP
jgi:hypothetical protein